MGDEMTTETPLPTCSECHGPAEIAEHEWPAELLCVPCALELRGRPTQADLAAAESARAEERRRALEEAALRCDALAEEKDDSGCEWCAAAIRALPSAPAPLPTDYDPLTCPVTEGDWMGPHGAVTDPATTE